MLKELIYIDDLIDVLICDLQGSFTGFQYKEITNTYNVNLQTLSETLHSFKNSRNSLISERSVISLPISPIFFIKINYLFYLFRNTLLFDFDIISFSF